MCLTTQLTASLSFSHPRLFPSRPVSQVALRMCLRTEFHSRVGVAVCGLRQKLVLKHYAGAEPSLWAPVSSFYQGTTSVCCLAISKSISTQRSKILLFSEVFDKAELLAHTPAFAAR